MTEDEAVAMMCEATAKIDWMNLGRVFTSLGDNGFKWGKYDKSMFKPNFDRAFDDRKWLTENAVNLQKAIETLKKNRNAL